MKRILLVEDDRFLRRACEIGLRAKGHVVVTAIDGEEGLRLARSDQFDLILLDMMMPKLGGLDVLRQLKADPDTSSTPVMILSNSTREHDIAEVRRLGAVDYVVKANVTLDQLAERLADFFAAAR
jgi:CheY-like chemotaxis protein